MSLVVALSLFVCAVISPSLLHGADRMRSGQWESTAISGDKTATHSHCVTAEEVKASNGSVEDIRASVEKSAASLHCTLEDFKMETNTLSYTYSCPKQSTHTKTTFGGDTYLTEVTSKDGGEEHTAQFKGRRTGDCQ